MPKTIISKKCYKCKKIRPLSEFYKNRTKGDGLQDSCKDCDKARQKQLRQTKDGQIHQKAYQKKYRPKYIKTERGRQAIRKGRRKWEKNNPEKIKAKDAVNNAIRAGKLPRPDSLKCYYCPKQAEQYHHHKGYAKEHWLDVIPVCRKCHRQLP